VNPASVETANSGVRGAGGAVGTVRPAENSEVLPMASVAVAVTMRPLATATLNDVLKLALPLASVVTLVKPRNCCPSAGSPSGSVSLAKNSTRKVEPGAPLSVPVMVVMPPDMVTVDSTGRFWKLLGSLGAPWPLESLGVRPSSRGKRKPLVRSMPSRGVGADEAVARLRPLRKTLLPSMALPTLGCPEADTGLPKTAMPPVPLNSTRLPAPATVPPMRLNDTPGSLGWAGPSGAPKPLELRNTMPCNRLATGVMPSPPTPEKLPWMMLPGPPLSTSMPAPLKPTTLRAPAIVPPTVLLLPPEISMPNRLLPSGAPGAGAGSVRLPTLLTPSAATP